MGEAVFREWNASLAAIQLPRTDFRFRNGEKQQIREL